MAGEVFGGGVLIGWRLVDVWGHLMFGISGFGFDD